MNPSNRPWLTLHAGVALLALALSACSPDVPIFRFQLINQTPYAITQFRVATSEAGLDSAANYLTTPLATNSVADADVRGSGAYWLRATADMDGTAVTRTRGPMTLAGGTAGWAWNVVDGNIVDGMDEATLYAQTNLPILVIDTAGTEIPDEPKITATLHVFDNQEGTPNQPGLTEADFTSLIGIERRGNSTQTFPKASWGMELRDETGEGVDAPLLGMPEEEDWVLYAPWMDRSLIRNVFGYGLWEALGYYAPRTRFCEVYLRDDPNVPLAESYVGVYVLTEKIKRDGDRVDIAKLDENDTIEPEITGGYLLEIMEPSRLDDDEVGLPLTGGFVASLVYPKPDNITSAQKTWIRNYLSAFESSLFSNSFINAESGYARFVHTDSFVDYMILQEFFKNRDAFHSSTFLSKDREGPLTMGPIWDLNIGMGYFSFNGMQETSGWILNGTDTGITRSPWTARLLDDPAFRERFAERWNELRDGLLSTTALNDRIDAIAAELNTAQARQFIRWPSLGMTLFPDIRFLMFTGPHPDSYQGELAYMKTWLQDRAAWMDANLDSL